MSDEPLPVLAAEDRDENAFAINAAAYAGLTSELRSRHRLVMAGGGASAMSRGAKSQCGTGSAT